LKQHAGAATASGDRVRGILEAETMKKLLLVVLAAAWMAGGPSRSAEVIVADHTVVDQFEQIPLTYINLAKAKRVLFMHQSTGEFIWDLGLGCLAGLHGDPNYYPQECVQYAQSSPYDRSNWNWPIWYSQFGGPQADAIAKMDQFVDTVNALVTPPGSAYNVVGMKFCYVDGWNQAWYYDPQWWPTPPTHGYRYHYRQHMEDLERANPGKQFIWATSALWIENHPNCGDISNFNEVLRAYARANGKLLFDIADIESHDPNGNACKQNGCESMCPEYSFYPPNNDSHPNVVASIRLAKAFWWLMARASGWSGPTGGSPAPPQNLRIKNP
jgi:hypothetical protein